jgi:hypothetical protein
MREWEPMMTPKQPKIGLGGYVASACDGMYSLHFTFDESFRSGLTRGTGRGELSIALKATCFLSGENI